MKFVSSSLVRSLFHRAVAATTTPTTTFRNCSTTRTRTRTHWGNENNSNTWEKGNSTRGRRFPPTQKKRADDLNSKEAALPLTEQQSEILSAVCEGQSVFVTGSAGTGKTVFLKRVIKQLARIHGRNHVFVTASTGVAACALNGQTIHSFAGIEFTAAADRDTLLLKALANKRAFKRWNKVKALVIDEVSMVDGNLFDNLDYIARQLRSQHKDRVWGGIQLIVTGDFFQLPPILHPHSSPKEFTFEADCWNASFHLQIELTRIFRQSDSQFIQLLQGIRRGCIIPDHLQLLNRCCAETEPDPSVTRLYPRNQDVQRVNEERLRSLGREIITYTALDSGEHPRKNQLKKGIAPEELELCLGARVLLIKNINVFRGLVNGATGTVTAFVDPPKDTTVMDICGSGLLPRVQFDSGPEVVIEPDTWDLTEGDFVFATRKQVPLILAWALSIHKCQGMTLNCLHTDLSRAFGCGMVYVALSRVRSLDGLHLSGFSPSKIKAHPKVLQFYQRFPCNPTP